MGTFSDSCINIDELNFNEVKFIGEQYESAEFTNYKNFDVEIDVNALFEYIKSIDGRDKIKNLTIRYHSHLRNVEIIKLFPNLQSLSIYGHRIESLDGLEWFKGGSITIETGNCKRNIEKLSTVPIKGLFLEFGRKEDYDTIKQCTSLNHLTISKCPDPDFYEWKSIPLEYLKFWNYCKITELRDMSQINTLTRVMVGACRKFNRVTGDNSSVKEFTVDGSRLFDIHSVTSLPNAEYIGILDGSREISFSELPEHLTVNELKLWFKKVHIDMFDIKKKMPMLKKLDIAKTTKDQRRLLSEANPDIEIFAY